MNLSNLISSLLTLRFVGAYLVAPPGVAAPGSDPNCSSWVQQSYSLSCANIERFLGITEAQFEAWNPSVTELGAGCNLISGLYYCVRINYSSVSTLSIEPPTSTSTQAPTTSSLVTTTSSKILTTSSTSSTLTTSTTPACTAGVAIASSTPSGVICGQKGVSAGSSGSGSLLGYAAGSPFVLNAQACVAQCLATATCTNVYFIAGTTCNLHYGPISYTLTSTGGYEIYSSSCFTPPALICGQKGVSAGSSGSGSLLGYAAGSPFVLSAQACGAQCLATATCTNVYFIAGTTCNLHYGPISYTLTSTGGYEIYSSSCFIDVYIKSPTPAGAVCNVQAFSAAGAGAGTLTGYGAGSPYVTSIQACAAICFSTSTCTNVYFVSGTTCNLHYGVNSYTVNDSGVGGYSFYDLTCFSTCPVPTPYQTGIAKNCNKYRLVVSGDQCGTIATSAGVTLANFYLWNPAVGSTCASLGLGDYVCIGIS